MATLYVDNAADFTITNDADTNGIPTNGDTVTWNPGAGSQHGGAVPGLVVGTNAFTSIQGAVTASTAGDTVRVGPGTFSEGVNVSKQLTVLGNQTGLDAQTGRVGAAETIVTGVGNNGVTPFQITANDVVLDGFTIEGATSGNQFGFGILIGAGTNGSEISNNIIQSNIAGISLANNSASNQTVIEQNLIRNNNQPGPVSGTGIYTDQFNAGGALTNVLIDNNTFTGNSNVAVLIGPTAAASSASDITISRNVFTSSGNAILLFNTLDSTIAQNEISASVGSQVVIGGGNNGIDITQNIISGGAGRGIRIGDVGGGSANQNVTINRNSITGNATAGLEIESGGYTGAAGSLNAELNWWGSATGPTIASNPGGTGSTIVDPLGQVDYVPFLTSGVDSQPGVRGFQPVVADLSITKTDSSDPVNAGGNITYTITLTNSGPSDAQTVSLTDAIPLNTTFVSASQTSGPTFTLNSPSGGGTGTFTATAAALPTGANAVFQLVVRVNASTPQGTIITNTASATTTTADSNAANDSDVETTGVNAVANLQVTKTDSPDPVNPGENLTYTITVSNLGSSDAQTVALTDVIPVNTTFVSAAQASGPAFTLITPPAGDTGTFTATTGTFAAGATATFTLVVQVDSTAAPGSEISNTATVTTTTTYSNLTNNSDTETTTVQPLGLPECEVTTLNSPGDPGTASIEDDADNPGENVLIVTGTSKNDVIVVEPQPKSKGMFRVVQNKRVIVTFISTEVSRIVVFGLAGNDAIVVNGSMSQSAKLFGDEGNDVITGGRGDDGIDGGSGNDKIFGGAGNDTLCGEDGNDQIFGGSGNDLIGGEDGNDKLYGESGNDLVLGGDGNDQMYGGSGDDRLYGQVGNDQIFGESGNDIAVGGDGNDKLYGGAGRDLLIGSLGVDSLFGGAGDDILIGGSTAHDEDDEALQAILSEWTSNRSYLTRIDNLRNGGGNNGVFTLDDATVSDDGDKDTLTGEGNQDWFLIGDNDKVKDKANNELVN